MAGFRQTELGLTGAANDSSRGNCDLDRSLAAGVWPALGAAQQRERAKVRRRFSPRPELWMCRVDESRIGTIALDLVSATMRAMYADGSLIIKTRRRTFDTRNVGDYPGGRIGQFAFITVRESRTGLS